MMPPPLPAALAVAVVIAAGLALWAWRTSRARRHAAFDIALSHPDGDGPPAAAYACWLEAGTGLVRARIPLRGTVRLGRDPALLGARWARFPHPAVSGLHCALLEQAGEFYVLDEGSRNGTYVNRRRLERGLPCLLRDGDVVDLAPADLGGARLRLEMRAPAPIESPLAGTAGEVPTQHIPR